jgi:hypothetical protein
MDVIARKMLHLLKNETTPKMTFDVKRHWIGVVFDFLMADRLLVVESGLIIH